MQGSLILLLDALLQLQHDGAGSVDYLDVVASGQLVGGGRFAMGTQQHLDAMQLSHIVVVNGDKSHLFEAFTLHAVVYDVAQTIEDVALGQFLLSFLDSGSHTEAEAAAVVNLDGHRLPK